MVVAFDGVVVSIEGLEFGDSVSFAGCENWCKTGVVLYSQIGAAIFV
jgi:hypothetical protein